MNVEEKVSSVRRSQPALMGSTVGAALVIYGIQGISWRYVCLSGILWELIRVIFISLGKTVVLPAPLENKSYKQETNRAVFLRYSSDFITCWFWKASGYFRIIFFSQQVHELPCVPHSLNSLKTLQKMHIFWLHTHSLWLSFSPQSLWVEAPFISGKQSDHGRNKLSDKLGTDLCIIETLLVRLRFPVISMLVKLIPKNELWEVEIVDWGRLSDIWTKKRGTTVWLSAKHGAIVQFPHTEALCLNCPEETQNVSHLY